MMLTAIVYGGGKIERNYSESGFVNYEAWKTQDVEIISEFSYVGELVGSGLKMTLTSNTCSLFFIG